MSKLTRALLGAIVFLAVSNVASAAVSPPESPLANAGHLRLIEPLDRPQDGYCLDIMGSGRYVRFDMPMTAHNCKSGLYADEAVVLDEGTIRFPAYNVCATAAGLNKKVLPHTAVVPRRCNEESPFIIAGPMQKFTLRADGYVELTGSGLCMTVGDYSESTFDDTHRWRPLYLDRCDRVEEERSKWKFVPRDDS